MPMGENLVLTASFHQKTFDGDAYHGKSDDYGQTLIAKILNKCESRKFEPTPGGSFAVGSEAKNCA